MKSKIQTQAEKQKCERLYRRALQDGLDLTNYNLKTLNLVERLYKAIDGRESLDNELLTKYEENAVSTNSLSEETGIARTTLMKEPYVSIIKVHRRRPKRQILKENSRPLLEEITTLKEWQKGHAQTELELINCKRELEKAIIRINELKALINSKNNLIEKANDILTEAGLKPVSLNRQQINVLSISPSSEQS